MPLQILVMDTLSLDGDFVTVEGLGTVTVKPSQVLPASWLSSPMFSFLADSSRLVSEARSGRVVEGLPVARVLGHLEATGAKAKPVLRSLYGTVGEMGRTHGYDTTVGMFTQLGFVTEPPTDTGARAGSYQVVNSLLQNSVGPVSHVTLPPCHPAPAPAPTALTCSRHDASTCTG